MLSLGAHVVSVEPQADLAQALNETVQLNCWGERSTLINALACPRGRRPCLRSQVPRAAFRHGGGVPSHVVLPEVSGLPLIDILTSHSGGEKVDFLKLDGDGPERMWLDEVHHLIKNGNLVVDAITIEHMPQTRAINRRTLQSLQRLGYDIFRLDTDDLRRWIDRFGWDAFSPPFTYRRLMHRSRNGTMTEDPRRSLETEVLSLRTIRHAWLAHDDLSDSQWQQWISSVDDELIRWHTMEILIVHRRVGLIENRTMPSIMAKSLRRARREEEARSSWALRF